MADRPILGRQTAPEPSREQLSLAEKHDELARGCLQSAAESWERSDTDGFLSQWASNLTAEEHRETARLYRDGGYALFPILATKEGKVHAKRITTTWGDCWILTPSEATRFGRKFIPVDYEGRSRVQKKLGLFEAKEWAPAYVKIAGEGHGLSGRAWVAVFRRGNGEEQKP